MPGKKWYFFPLLVVLFYACDKDLSNVNCTEVNAAYSASIKPLVQSRCLTSGCHSSGSQNGDFTTYQGLKTVAENGALEDAVIVDKRMPPNNPLSKEERKKFRCWIDQGAPNN